MVADKKEERLAAAQILLAAGRPDEAIEQLRDPSVINDPRVCAELARAYFQRGDSKGDVYSSQFFAARAMELGDGALDLPAIVAAGAFRRERYDEAVKYFERVVTGKSSAAVQYLYGLALHELGRGDEALTWLERARVADPANEEIAAACQASRATDGAATKRVWKPAHPTLMGLRNQRPEGVASPRSSNAFSLLRGQAQQPKDFAWMAANVPCQAACPAGTDIPAYLERILAGDHEGAYRINLEHNVLPGVLGRVCARPCEAACRHGWEGLGEPVAICHSKRAAADGRPQSPLVLPAWFPASGKRVAVVGAGPAGLAGARELSRLGHRVTVFEKYGQPGGMLNQGIPEFRLPRPVIEQEIEQIRLQGVEIRSGIAIGRDISFAALVEENDAVVLAAGTLRPNRLDLPGKELAGIHHGLEVLLAVNGGRPPSLGSHVIVIGGGFTAMDCARTAVRLGDKSSNSVKVLYRRSQVEMLVTPGEIEELGHEGIPMEFMVAPVAFVGDGAGRVQAMRFVRTELGEPDASGRRRPLPVRGSEFELPATAVLLATGQFPDGTFLGLEYGSRLVDEEGWLKSGKSTKTGVPKVFVAGDFATGASSIIGAIGHAKQCARDVDRFLTGTERLKEIVEIADATSTGRIREMDDEPRVTLPVLPVAERSLTSEVERGYTGDQAKDETQRCYQCNHKFEIDPTVCIFCDWCVKAKPRPDCIVKVSQILADAEGRITGFQRAKSTEDTKLIWINQADCIRCGACVEACPVDAISLQKASCRNKP